MDLNYLYRRQQISLYMSENAACHRSRSTHREFTQAYTARIAVEREARMGKAA